MTMLYAAPFDVVKGNELYVFGTLTMSSSGSTDIVLTLASITGTAVDGTTGVSTFWPWADYSSTSPSAGYIFVQDRSPYAQTRYAKYSKNAWHGAITSALQAAATLAGDWGTKAPRCTFSASTGFYSFAVTGSTCTVAWSGAGGRKLFGFSGNASPAAASHTGTRTPLYVINPTLQAVSDPSMEYEPRAIATSTSSDTGAGFGTARYVAPLHQDWRQEFETKEKTARPEADISHPWTFQHLFEHCRGIFPFLVNNGGYNDSDNDPKVFRLREDGVSWTPERATPGNDAQFHIPFRCSVEGTLEDAAS